MNAMTEEIIKVDQNAALPAELQEVAHELGIDGDDFTIGSGISVPKISLLGSRFRFMEGGEVTEVANEIFIIPVSWMKQVGRVFFNQAYDPSVEVAPVCWSNDGEAPDPGATLPQAVKCAVCPQNVKGSDARGKGRACGFILRLAVVVATRTAENTLAWKDKVYALTLKGGSLFNNEAGAGWYCWREYTALLKKSGLKPFQMLTHVAFNENESVPVLKFRPASPEPLPADKIAQALKMFAEYPKEVREAYITIGRSGDLDSEAATDQAGPAQPPIAAPVAPAAAPVAPAAAPVAPAAAPVAPAAPAAAPVAPAAPAAAPVQPAPVQHAPAAPAAAPVQPAPVQHAPAAPAEPAQPAPVQPTPAAAPVQPAAPAAPAQPAAEGNGEVTMDEIPF